jgi:hypothetical protein
MHLSPQPGMQGCLVAVDLRCLPADATFGPRGIVDTCASLLHSPCRKVGHIATYLDEVHGIKRDEKTCGAAAFKKAGDRPVSFEGLSTSGCMLMGCQHMLLLGGLNTTAGERYAHVYHMAARAVEQHSATVLYGDLMCKWGKYVQAISQQLAGQPTVPPDVPKLAPEQVQKLQLMVSAVHVMTHSWYCRVSDGASSAHAVANYNWPKLANAWTHHCCAAPSSTTAATCRAVIVVVCLCSYTSNCDAHTYRMHRCSTPPCGVTELAWRTASMWSSSTPSSRACRTPSRKCLCQVCAPAGPCLHKSGMHSELMVALAGTI